MHLGRLRECKSKKDVIIQIGGAEIPFVDSLKYLGTHLDCSLMCSKHIKMLKGECLKRIALLKCLAHMAWGAADYVSKLADPLFL